MINKNTNQTMKLSLKFKNKNNFIQNIKHQSKNQMNKYKKLIKLILNIVPAKSNKIN
jgi:ribosomal protein S8